MCIRDRSENTSTSAPAVKETPVSSEDSTLTTSIPTFPRRAALKEDERSVGDLPRVSTSGAVSYTHLDVYKRQVEDIVQRGHNFAIVDEVDSILIDEARTPLIISGPAQGEADQWYNKFASLVTRLERAMDYEVDEKKHTVGVTDVGIAAVEDFLGIDNLYEAAHTPLIGFRNNAIKAKERFKRYRDYIVSVSYTHLDVYKRQHFDQARRVYPETGY